MAGRRQSSKRQSSLKTVYYRSFSFLIVIPLMLVFSAAMAVVSYMIRDGALDTIDAFQENVASALAGDIKTASLQLSHFAYVNDGEFMALAARVQANKGSEQYAVNQELERAFRTAMVPSQSIVAGKFYMKDGSGVYMKDDIRLPYAHISTENWYCRALADKNTVVVGGYDTSKTKLTYTSQKGRQLILVTAMSPNFQTDKSERIEMLAYFTVSGVGEVLRTAKNNKTLGATVLLDGDNNLLYGDMGDVRVQEYFKQNAAQCKPGTFTQKAALGGQDGKSDAVKPYVFKVRTVPMSDWRIVTFVESAVLTQGFVRVGGLMVLVVMCLLALFSFFSRYFLNAIVTPVHAVAAGMQQLVQNNLDVQVVPEGHVEIRTLTESFNQMVRSLKHMLLVNDEAHKRKHDAEIQALQSQINPHFIVNTLNSIRFMAQMAKFDGMRKMAESLIKIVSCSFRGSISFYTVREELEVLDSYLYLMRIRYSDGFDVRYEVDESCLACRLPRLTLQPIVENSILHGFADMGEELGQICISVAREGDYLLLCVRDNGRGMTQAEIEQVMRGRDRPHDDNTSIGLQNVLARIRLNFGARAQMQMESEPGVFTRTVLRLPVSFEAGQADAGISQGVAGETTAAPQDAAKPQGVADKTAATPSAEPAAPNITPQEETTL